MYISLFVKNSLLLCLVGENGTEKESNKKLWRNCRGKRMMYEFNIFMVRFVKKMSRTENGKGGCSFYFQNGGFELYFKFIKTE